MNRELSQDIGLLEATLAANPNHWSAHWLLGKALEIQGRPEEAREALENAYRLQRSDSRVVRAYTRICLTVGEIDQGLEAAERAVALSPADPDAVANLALALLLDGQLDEADATIREAIESDPNDEVTRNVSRMIQQVKSGDRPQPHRLGELY